jgi:hypothetical protein
MSKRIKDCPQCGEADALEFYGAIWLDNVVAIEHPAPDNWGAGPWYEIVTADPATTADTDTGIVYTADDRLQCRHCGFGLDTNHGDRSLRFFERWKMVKPSTVARRRRRNRAT